MDGLKLYLQQACHAEIQERYYNGWTHDHYVSGVFCFCPDGTIPIAFYNVPGAVHDSQIAEMGNIYEKLEKMWNLYGGKCTVDSAFGRVNREFIIKLSQDDLFLNADNFEDQVEEIQIARQATSMRQAAEWGMRALQSSFPRMKDRFVYEERGERRITLKLFVLLFNMRARMVGINQIKNVYMANLNRDAEEILGNETDF